MSNKRGRKTEAEKKQWVIDLYEKGGMDWKGIASKTRVPFNRVRGILGGYIRKQKAEAQEIDGQGAIEKGEDYLAETKIRTAHDIIDDLADTKVKLDLLVRELAAEVSRIISSEIE